MSSEAYKSEASPSLFSYFAFLILLLCQNFERAFARENPETSYSIFILHLQKLEQTSSMAERAFGKRKETSSSSSSIPLDTQGRRQPNPRSSTQKQIDTETPRKAIKILRSNRPEYRRIARTKLLEILMQSPNPDTRKSVTVDVDSEDEFDETLDEIRGENLPLKERMWYWKVDDYNRTDAKFQKHKRKTHQSVSFGTKAPDELKSLVSSEYSHHIIESYNVKVSMG